MLWYVGDVRVVERSHALFFLEFFFTTLAVVTVSMRMFTRAVLVRNVGIDDVLMCFAVVSSLLNDLIASFPSPPHLLTAALGWIHRLLGCCHIPCVVPLGSTTLTKRVLA